MSSPYHVAKIDEDICIGCTKCIQVCPFDAILGANKQMHVVLTELCVGCDLCLPPCPVDAISLVETSLALSPKERAKKAKHRFQARKQRLARFEKQKQQSDQILIENMSDIINASVKKALSKTLAKPHWEYHE